MPIWMDSHFGNGKIRYQRPAIADDDAVARGIGREVSGFDKRGGVYRDTVENSPNLARFAAHHRPFYEQLYAQRLDVTIRDRVASSSRIAPA